ncbi:MAG: SUMF1/EgtB/PvdO family nonheme iron enzyme [bacterium]
MYDLAGSPLTLGMICVASTAATAACPATATTCTYARRAAAERPGRASNELVAQRRLWLTDLARAWWDAGGTREPDTALREDTCIALLGRRGVAADAARDELRVLDLRAGLLAWAGSHQSWRRYRFAHRSFAEFLVACRLTENAGQTDLQTAGLDAGWREVALMYVAELARASSGSKEPAWRYVGHLLDRAENDREPWSTRGAAARLAAECLAEWRDLPSAQAPVELGQRLDMLQDAFLDLTTSRQIAVADRAAFWTAVGPHNRVVKEHDRWVDVPAGRFWFGAAPGKAYAQRDGASSRVVRMSAFRIQAWPVTVEEFSVFVVAGGYRRDEWWSKEGLAWRTESQVNSPRHWPIPGRPHHPVTGVSWWEAQAYCGWLSERHQRPVNLPTEAQWEYAARGSLVDGTAVARYPWGQDDDPDRRAGRRGYGSPVPPGVFPGGRAWSGTWNQSGCVWEWCRDAFADQLPGGSTDPKRPTAPAAHVHSEAGRLSMVREIPLRIMSWRPRSPVAIPDCRLPLRAPRYQIEAYHCHLLAWARRNAPVLAQILPDSGPNLTESLTLLIESMTVTLLGRRMKGGPSS